MMSPASSLVRLATTVSLSVAVAVVALDARPAGPASAAGVPLSLRVANEAAPPGALVQLKVFVTEPRPISTGLTSMTLDGFDTVAGIALSAASRDALAVAVRQGSTLSFSILSPSMTFGTSVDYPVMTIVARVSASASLGAQLPVTLDAMQFVDGAGNLYAASVNPGSVFVTPYVGIENVVPGSGVAAAGEVVTLVGRNFEPGTGVRVKEWALSSVAFVDPAHINLTFAQPTRLQGSAIQVSNPDKTRSTYFAYQRTSREGTSLNPTLQAAVPVFPDADVTRATVPASAYATGLALQNRRGPSAVAVCQLVDASGAVLAVRSLTVDPQRFVLRDLSELFGSVLPTDSVVVQSVIPIQVMGVAVDAAGGAAPIAAR